MFNFILLSNRIYRRVTWTCLENSNNIHQITCWGSVWKQVQFAFSVNRVMWPQSSSSSPSVHFICDVWTHTVSDHAGWPECIPLITAMQCWKMNGKCSFIVWILCYMYMFVLCLCFHNIACTILYYDCRLQRRSLEYWDRCTDQIQSVTWH